MAQVHKDFKRQIKAYRDAGRLNELEQAIEIAGELAEEYRKNVRAYLKDRTLGTGEATREQAEFFVKVMIGAIPPPPGSKLEPVPPQWWIAPDGHEEFNSAWIICLREKFVSEPKGFWRDVMAAIERMGPMPIPVMQPVAAGGQGSVPPATAMVATPPPPLGAPL